MASSFKPKKALKDLAIPLASNDLPALVSNLAPNAKNIFDRKISGNRAVRAGKGFTTFILNKDINGTITIIKLLEDSGVLIYGVTETVKDEIKNQDGRFLAPLLAFLAASLVQPLIHLVVKGISGRGVKIAGRGYIDKHF